MFNNTQLQNPTVQFCNNIGCLQMNSIQVATGAMCRQDDKQKQLTCWTEDGHATIVYLYLSCVKAKNTTQSLLRDVVQSAVKKQHCHQMCCGGMRCTVVQQACSYKCAVH